MIQSVIDDKEDIADSAMELLIDVIQKVIKEQEKSLKTFPHVRRQGLFGKQNAKDVVRREAAKSNEDFATLLPRLQRDRTKFSKQRHQVFLAVSSSMRRHRAEQNQELREEDEAIHQASLEAMSMFTAIAFPVISGLSKRTIDDLRKIVENADLETLTESLQIAASIASQEAVVNVLKVENPLPIHYRHTSVPEHAPRLVGEGNWQVPKKGVIYQEGQPSKKGTPEAGPVQTYEVVTTLRQAAEKTGIERDEILTTRDIEAEYHINKKLVHEYTRRGREGHPHLTPLSVRLSGGRGGQLLFRREDIERLVANPPSSYKGGRPRK
jgi:hypothetical protein